MSFNRDYLKAENLGFIELFARAHVGQLMTGNITLGADAPSVQILDANDANRVVTMPAEADVEGKLWLVKNTQPATNTVTLNNDAAGAICAIAATGAALVGVFGGTWIVFFNGAAS